MSGSTPTLLHPAGGQLDPALRGSLTPDGLASRSSTGSVLGPAAPCEPPAEPSLLRGDGGVLGGADDDRPRFGRIEEIVSQLAPIRSRTSLLSSFEREANPNDELIRAAYECVWADLVVGLARTNTRRARIRATMVQARGGGLRGRG